MKFKITHRFFFYLSEMRLDGLVRHVSVGVRRRTGAVVETVEADEKRAAASSSRSGRSDKARAGCRADLYVRQRKFT